ncbi:MAG TPA: ECF transporter S component [Thermomicrobiales bacterium]|nr:ECF transporter S component [Thermomicrobiales bacterium]
MTCERSRFGSPLLLLLSLVGVASFLYPFFLPALAGAGARPARGGIEVPLVFTALGIGCLLVMLLDVQSRAGAGDRGASKMVALLGMLVAVDASLRLVPTLLGASAIFLLIVLVGYAYGAEFGFLMGALTLFVSALLTGGLGPWLPYQMLGAGWVGLTAGWLPRSGATGGRGQLVMLAVFGGLWGFLYGAILNLMEWPFAAPGLSERAGLYWVPGMSVAETFGAYLRFYLTTSLVYDAFRAVANVALILALGRPVLRLLERYRARFVWQPWTSITAGDETPVPARRGAS